MFAPEKIGRGRGQRPRGVTFSIQDDPWGSREALVAFWLDIRKSKAFKVDFKLPKKEVHSLCQISDTKVPGRRWAGLGIHRGPEDCDTRPRHRAGRGSSARRTAARSPVIPEERSSARQTAARNPVIVPEERNRPRHLVLDVRHGWLRRPCSSDNNEPLEPGFHQISDATSRDGRTWVLTPKTFTAE